jgi:hypothetical protein
VALRLVAQPIRLVAMAQMGTLAALVAQALMAVQQLHIYQRNLLATLGTSKVVAAVVCCILLVGNSLLRQGVVAAVDIQLLCTPLEA